MSDLRNKCLNWVRLPQILTPAELKDKALKRQALDLYVDICGRLAEKAGDDPNNPSPLTLVHARSVFSDTWKIYRESSDATIVHENMNKASYHAGRAGHVRDTECRVRVKGVLVRSTKTTIEGLEAMARAGRVYTMPKGKPVKRKKKGVG